jgi:LmbE family N-acetylglucosaminyl deacetylase
MTKLLVFTPHCDDETISCGGYIARTLEEGGEVMIAVASVSDIEFLHEGRVPIKTRISELESAINQLGGCDYELLTKGYESNLHQFPMGDLVAKMDKVQDEFEPTEVLIPLPSCHQDHAYMYTASVAATRPSLYKHQPNLIAAYEYPLTNWGEGAEANSFRGGMYVDVTSQWAKKNKALNCYKSQMRKENDLISTYGCEALARMRGLEIGVEFAELFHIMRYRR